METSIPRRKELKKKEKEKENMTPFHSRKILNEEWSQAQFPRGCNNGMCSVLYHGLRRKRGGGRGGGGILAYSVKNKGFRQEGHPLVFLGKGRLGNFCASTPGFLLEVVLAPHVRVGGKCIVLAKASICISMVRMDIFFYLHPLWRYGTHLWIPIIVW